MRFCSQCGAARSASAAFCARCGTRFPDAQADPPPGRTPAPAPAARPWQVPPPRLPRARLPRGGVPARPTLLAVGLLTLGVLTAGVLGVALLTGKSPTSPPPQAVEAAPPVDAPAAAPATAAALPAMAPAGAEDDAPPADSPPGLRDVQRAFECNGSDFDVALMTITGEADEETDFATPSGLLVFGLHPSRIWMASGLVSEFRAPVEEVADAIRRRHPAARMTPQLEPDGGQNGYLLSVPGGPPSSVYARDGVTVVQCGG